MSIEHTLVQFELSLARFSDCPANVTVPSRAWWQLTQIVLGGLLITYLAGWVQDFQRVRDLRAEPSPSSKVVITKREAWDRVHPRPARSRAWVAVVVRPWRLEDTQPLDDPPDDWRIAMTGS